MKQKDYALKLCKEWNKTKKNRGLTKLRALMEQHNNICKSILKELENKKYDKLKEDIEETLYIYRLEGVEK